MTKINLEHRLREILNIWEKGESNKIKTFYSSKVQGTLNLTQKFTFNDIEHRIQYLATHQQNRHYELLDCVTADNKIAIRTVYRAYDKKLKQDIHTIIAGFYCFDRTGLIETVDIITSDPFNYCESL